MPVNPNESSQDISDQDLLLLDEFTQALRADLKRPIRMVIQQIGQEALRQLVWDIYSVLTYESKDKAQLSVEEIRRGINREARLKAQGHQGGRLNKVQLWLETAKRMYADPAYNQTPEKFQRMQESLASEAKRALKRTSRWKLNKRLQKAGLAPLPF